MYFSAHPRLSIQTIAQSGAFSLPLLLALAGAQAAEPDAAFNYSVQIEAPAALQTLLESNLDIVRWRGNQRIDRAQLQRLYRAAPDQIRELVATEGYYSPEISPSIEQRIDSARVKFVVQPGPPALVGQVDLELTGFGASQQAQAALRDKWLLPSGRVFRQADWEAAKRDLLRQATLAQFPRAQLTETQAVVDPETRQVSLKVALDSGPAVTFGELQIEGLQRYPASIVTRLNRIKPGDPYSEAALLELQARLQDSGYFSGVQVSTEADVDHPSGSTTPVLVRVTENKRKKAAVGIGYSTNTGQRGQLTYDDLNLAGLRLKSGITLETRKQSAHGDLYFPVTEQGYSHSIGAAFERTDIGGEVTALTTLAAKRAWGVPALERSVTLEYVTERKSVAGLEASRSQSLPLTYAVTWRRTDSLLFPAKGYLLNLQLGGALLPVLTDRSFVRGYARFAHYNPVGAKGTLILRGEAGAVAARDREGIPATYLFRAGGDQSVRGYGYQQLGVRDGDAVVGGRYLAVASAEYQHWLLPNWGGAVFYDAGDAADRTTDLTPHAGYGVGARWKSPVGPVNLDFAYGRAVKEYRLHFSLGFTF
jgi:translocation and assembly module TamA